MSVTAPGARTLLSAAVSPAAPLAALPLAYTVFHPPRRPHHRLPAEFDLDSTEHMIAVPGSSQLLHAWYVERSPSRVVVLGHGVGLSKSASLAHAAFLARAGYSVCLFDHRNHGASSQDRATWGMSERFTDDVAAVVGHVRSLPQHADAKVAVYGFSFSTFPSLYILRRVGTEVDAVICDSGPGEDLPQLWSRFLASGALPVPDPLRRGPAGRCLGWTFARVASAMLKASWPPPPEGRFDDTPMLLLAGSDDQIVPAEQVRRLGARYPRARVVEIAGAPHLQLLKTNRDRYIDSVLGFLAAAWE